MFKLITLTLCVSSLWVVPAHTRSKGLRIIGGTEAKAAQFPFAAAIIIETASSTYFCGGALISNQWVLTAGQCVDGAILFTIRLGSNSVSKYNPNALKLVTDTFLLHPQYNPDTLENDVGVIKFRLPITFTDYIKPVDVLATTALPDYSSVVTMGWGQDSDEVPGLVDNLQFVYLTTLTNEECRIAFGNQVNENQVCVDGNYNEGICRGDTGDPLIQYGGSGTVYHVGIASFLSGRGCESTDPSGFTRTTAYVTWIKNVTGLS